MTNVYPLVPAAVSVTPELFDALTRIDDRSFTETIIQLGEKDLIMLAEHPGLSHERLAEIGELLQERRIEMANQM